MSIIHISLKIIFHYVKTISTVVKCMDYHMFKLVDYVSSYYVFLRSNLTSSYFLDSFFLFRHNLVLNFDKLLILKIEELNLYHRRKDKKYGKHNETLLKNVLPVTAGSHLS